VYPLAPCPPRSAKTEQSSGRLSFGIGSEKEVFDLVGGALMVDCVTILRNIGDCSKRLDGFILGEGLGPFIILLGTLLPRLAENVGNNLARLPSKASPGSYSCTVLLILSPPHLINRGTEKSLPQGEFGEQGF
jgi:hypothetical protein